MPSSGCTWKEVNVVGVHECDFMPLKRISCHEETFLNVRSVCVTADGQRAVTGSGAQSARVCLQ